VYKQRTQRRDFDHESGQAQGLVQAPSAPAIPSRSRRRSPVLNVSCFCGDPENIDDLGWVECKAGAKCPNHGWLHLACLGMEAEDAKKLDKGWLCPDCDGTIAFLEKMFVQEYIFSHTFGFSSQSQEVRDHRCQIANFRSCQV
jgi:hypothetical protein